MLKAEHGSSEGATILEEKSWQFKQAPKNLSQPSPDI